MRQSSLRSLRIALVALGSLVLAGCFNGNDPDESAPVSLIVAARGNSLVRLRIDGTGQREFTGPTSIAQYGLHPTWASANGPILVHTTTAAGGSGVRIHAVDLSTGEVTRLSPTTSPLVNEWYPLATLGWVYFMGETSSGTFEVWRMRPSGAEMAKVPPTAPDYGNYYRPALSPDGRRLAVSTVVGSSIGVRTFTASSGAAISEWVSGATAPRWSPDSRQVAFSTPGGGVIRVMNADGTGLRSISTATFDEWFDWTADGRSLIASNASGLVIVTVATGTAHPIPGTAGMWQPAVIRAPGLD
jgi:Tol biopolymer transport system component